jgi:acetyl esterase/lipase
MNSLSTWCCVAFFSALTQNPPEERVRKDVAYSDAGGERTRLDIYAPAEGVQLPVVIWIHGGAWQMGNKSMVHQKPEAFNAKKLILVSINYRLHPAVGYQQQAGDVAQAIRWVRDHAEEFGGDPKHIFLMGHSAGAHLAALVGTDGRYLEAAGLTLKELSGIVLLDGAGYDIPRQIEQAMLPRLKSLYTSVFSEDLAAQRAASPITHVAGGKGIPPFLILHVTSRRDSKAQSNALGEKLRQAGVDAKVVPAQGKTHATINRELGSHDDTPTLAVFEFLGLHSKTRASGE